MSLDDYIRSVLNRPGGNRSPQNPAPDQRVPNDSRDNQRNDENPHHPHPHHFHPHHHHPHHHHPHHHHNHPHPLHPHPFLDLDRIIDSHFRSMFSSFFGSGLGSPAIDDGLGSPSSFGSTGGGWLEPRIEIWSWQDTRDEFGEDDQSQSPFGGFWGGGGGSGDLWGGGGGGGIWDGDDDGGNSSIWIDDGGGGGGNDNFNSDGDSFRGFLREFDDLFRMFGTPLDERQFIDGHHRRDDLQSDNDAMIRHERRSLRDSMLKGPIVGDDAPPKLSSSPPAPSKPDETLEPNERRDVCLDNQSEGEKTAAIDDLLKGSEALRDAGPRDRPLDRSFFGSTWRSWLPRNIWGGSDDVQGRWVNAFEDDADSDVKVKIGGNFGGGFNNSLSSQIRYSMKTTTHLPGGTLETKRKERGGDGVVTETIVRRRGGVEGTVIKKTTPDGAITVHKEGDQSLF